MHSQGLNLIENLAENLRWVRKQLGWSVKQLSQESEVSRGTIARLEDATGDVKLLTIVKLAEAVGVPVKRLLGL